MSATMSKKRFKEIGTRLEEILDMDSKTKVLDILCEVLKFDPLANTYEAVKERMKSEGKSSYDVNHKAYYAKNKTELNKKRYERIKNSQIIIT